MSAPKGFIQLRDSDTRHAITNIVEYAPNSFGGSHVYRINGPNLWLIGNGQADPWAFSRDEYFGGYW